MKTQTFYVTANFYDGTCSSWKFTNEQARNNHKDYLKEFKAVLNIKSINNKKISLTH
jgi:hypothetical protein